MAPESQEAKETLVISLRFRGECEGWEELLPSQGIHWGEWLKRCEFSFEQEIIRVTTIAIVGLLTGPLQSSLLRACTLFFPLQMDFLFV